ncbi:MAG: hypothetical protein AAF892_11955 [Cyanobacteria bacterium P01_D01_bin.71]
MRSLLLATAIAQGTYDQLVDLHDRQPALNVRSSTSVLYEFSILWLHILIPRPLAPKALHCDL